MSDTIYIKSKSEIEIMRQAGRITAGARSIARQAVAAGVTTRQIDKYVHEFIVKSGAKAAFLGYAGVRASAWVAVVVGVIPGWRLCRNLPLPRDQRGGQKPYRRHPAELL